MTGRHGTPSESMPDMKGAGGPDIGPSNAPPGLDRDSVIITPNRRELDHRFPSLSFHVSAGPRRYFEVLLATDRTLFGADMAGSRSEGNFYASRQEGGLIAIEDGFGQFLVPVPVLARLTAADPLPLAIYYTAIAYRDAGGGDPAYAMSPGQLPENAPFVAVSPDFSVVALTRGLSLVARNLMSFGPNRSMSMRATMPSMRLIGGLPISGGRTEPEPSVPDIPDPVHAAPEPVRISEAVTPVSSRPRVVPTVPAPKAPVAVEAPHPMVPDPEPGFRGPSREVMDNGYVDLDGPNRPPANGAPAEIDTIPDYDDGYADLDMLEPLPPSGPTNSGGNGGAPDAVEVPYDDGFGRFDDGTGSGAGERGASTASGGMLEQDEESGLTHQPLEAVAARGVAHVFDTAPSAADSATPSPPPSPDGRPAPIRDDRPDTATPPHLDPASSRAIIEAVSALESGIPRYDALSLDGEFRGRFGKDHPYYQRAHAGLGFGIARFNQDDGTLGRLLGLMQERDPVAFEATFGADASQLLAMTTTEGPLSPNSPAGRSARVQPLAGKDLWEEPWIERFRAAAGVPAFQAAQNQLAAALYLDPVAPYVADLGLGSSRGLAIAYDRAADMGLEAALDFVIHSAGPVRTEAQRSSVLAALGEETLEDFQRGRPGITVDGVFGPQTHAAMVRALRTLGTASPLALPAYEEMFDALVRAATTRPFGARLESLRNAPGLGDEILLP